MHERHPEKFIPLYSMVTFSDLPYSKALELGKKHDEFFNKLGELNELEEKLSGAGGEKLLDQWVNEIEN
jgi:kynurenine 3-monooxygenase